MGYVQKIDSSPRGTGSVSLAWDSLGQAVQRRSLEAVAQHFFEVGLAELCLDALAEAESKIPQGINNE